MLQPARRAASCRLTASRGWNDSDPSRAGTPPLRVSRAERQTQKLSLWSLASAALILGHRPHQHGLGDLSLLENSAVNAVDPDGNSGDRVHPPLPHEPVFEHAPRTGLGYRVFNTRYQRQNNLM